MNIQRTEKIRKLLKENNMSSFFVSIAANIFYLTGFKTLSPSEREAFILILKNKTFLFTDPRHDTKLEVGRKKLEVRLLTPQKKLGDQLKEILKKEKIKKLGFEEEDLKFIEYRNLSKLLRGVKLHPIKYLIPRLREQKEKDEIAQIKKAVKLAEACLRKVVRTIKVGVTEKEIAFRIEYFFKKNNFNISFQPIVAVDANSSYPHYDTQAGNAKVKKDSVVLIDFGAKVQEYCSDITRVFFMKKAKSEIINVYRELLEVQKETINSIKNMKQTREVDLYARNLLDEKNLPNIPHSTGHGIGLEVHELPSVSFKSKDQIKNNQVFTVEPGVYFEGKYGLRIEDMILIKGGKPQLLTTFPKKPYIL